MAPLLKISCLCRGVAQAVEVRAGHDGHLLLCHCDTCRHSSGVLCTSYYPISEPDLTQALRRFTVSAQTTQYFCGTCGCQVFRSKINGNGSLEWGAATGIITSSEKQAEHSGLEPWFAGHAHVGDTKDGGLSPWISEFNGEPMAIIKTSDKPTVASNTPAAPTSLDNSSPTLQAGCACGNVRFHITPPDAASFLPKSGWPDLTHPYGITPEEVKGNPTDEKWWIRAEGTKYMAGTCTCRSCRLITGFEIQTWAFVPRTNIFFHVKGSGGNVEVVPLDFTTLPPGILQNHASSPEVLREFCGTCGATVFWHDRSRPDVIDVSVGLLWAEEGAKAERWLEWWMGRVSFVEDAQTGRLGAIAEMADRLAGELERGMQTWGK